MLIEALVLFQGMFEKIWAADDFLLFKRLMIKHNLELEMQALNLIQIQDGYGTVITTVFALVMKNAP